MRAAWRLAISSLLRRRTRSVLLVCSVALCATLITAVACAMASLTKGLDDRIKATVGAADIKIRHIGGASFENALLATAESWPEIDLAIPRAQETLNLRNPKSGARESVIGIGILADREPRVRPLDLAKSQLAPPASISTAKPAATAASKPTTPETKGPVGRLPTALGQIAIDTVVARKLGLSAGDAIEVELFTGPVPLTVVGIVEQPPLGAIFEKMEAFTTVEQLSTLAEKPGRIGEIDLIVRPGVIAQSVVEKYKPGLPKGIMMQVTARITSGLDKNLQSQQVGFLLASALAFVASAFIITTGLTTAVSERARELAVLRCLGAFKAQLATSQLVVGAVIGGLGGLIGTPLGTAGSALLISFFPKQLPSGFTFSPMGVVLALLGSCLSGVIGAMFPAYLATKVSPLEGLSVRARRSKPSHILWTFAAAAFLLATAWSIVALSPGKMFFWFYLILGIPSLLTGWFLLAVPTTALLNAAISPILGKALGLPKGLLIRSIEMTPFRHGFTAGAMMLGLAIMVSIWANGGSILKDWLLALQIPDGFVQGLNMKSTTRDRVAAVPGVAATCSLTLQPIETDAFGIKGLSSYKTSFIAFEPRSFFEMTKVTWIEPVDPAEQQRAIAALEKGGSIIVAREFKVAQGLGAGDTVKLRHEGREHTFNIVGVVTSPGLDIVSKFYDVGEGYVDQALSSVFGSRKDLIDRFGNDAINLIQIQLKPGVDGEKVMDEIKNIRGGGILTAGSAVEIKARISEFISGALLIASSVAIGAMGIACFAVANLIVAAVQARQFEFGVLRAVGAHRGLLARLILGEALVIGLAACILGSGMGLQAAWGGQRINEVAIGLVLKLRPPVEAIGAGWLAVLLITIGAAMPSALGLLAKRPRELLAAMKG